MVVLDSRKYYESLTGKKISDSTWKRVKAYAREINLSVSSKADLERFFKVRLLAKKSRTTIKEVGNYFQGFKDVKNQKGIALYRYIYESLGISPHRTTLRHWFSGVYDPDKIYEKDQVFDIIFQALAYKRRLNNGTINKPNKSSQNSIKESI